MAYSKTDIARNQSVADKGDLFYIEGSGLYNVSGTAINKLDGKDEAEYKAMGVNIKTFTPKQVDDRFKKIMADNPDQPFYVNSYTGQRVKNTGSGTGGTGGGDNPYSSPVTGKFKDSAAYKALSEAEQEVVDLAFNVNFQGSEEEYQIYVKAIDDAMKLADPYAKAQLAMAKAEVGLGLAKLESDYGFSKEILDKTRAQLAEDLKNNKEFLSLEQQSDMATLLRGYDEDLLTIADQAAEKGITFATGARSRELAETRRTDQYKDVVQSSTRQYNFHIKDLEIKAARGDSNAQLELDKLKADKGFNLQKIGQNAERILGTSGVGSLGISGYKPVGGFLGEIEQRKREFAANKVREQFKF